MTPSQQPAFRRLYPFLDVGTYVSPLPILTLQTFIRRYGLRRERSVERYENPFVEGEAFRDTLK